MNRVSWLGAREHLSSLFSAAYDRPLDCRYLDWRYFENNNQELLFKLEFMENELAASYSAAPVELVRDKDVYKTALSMTTMTHPRWQGRGLFPKLARDLYADLTASGFALVWGFPNSKSHAIFSSKLNWTDIYEIPTMTLDLRSVKRAHLPDYPLQTDDDFQLGYPDLPADGLIRVRRSQEYLRWRYAKHPLNRYTNFVLGSAGTVSSYCVAKVFGNSFDLVDIQSQDAGEAKTILESVVRYAVERDLASMFCWAPTHHYLHAVLERLGFVNAAPITYFGAKALTPSSVQEDALSYRNWYVQMGDSDVY